MGNEENSWWREKLFPAGYKTVEATHFGGAANLGFILDFGRQAQVIVKGLCEIILEYPTITKSSQIIAAVQSNTEFYQRSSSAILQVHICKKYKLHFFLKYIYANLYVSSKKNVSSIQSLQTFKLKYGNKIR